MVESLDELGVELAEHLVAVVEEHTDVLLASDDDVNSKINDLVETILEKYVEFTEEDEESDVELHGNMDKFAG